MVYNNVQSVQQCTICSTQTSKTQETIKYQIALDRQTDTSKIKACVRHDKLSDMFPKNMKDHLMDKRVKEVYCVKRAKTERFNNC